MDPCIVRDCTRYAVYDGRCPRHTTRPAPRVESRFERLRKISTAWREMVFEDHGLPLIEMAAGNREYDAEQFSEHHRAAGIGAGVINKVMSDLFPRAEWEGLTNRMETRQFNREDDTIIAENSVIIARTPADRTAATARWAGCVMRETVRKQFVPYSGNGAPPVSIGVGGIPRAIRVRVDAALSARQRIRAAVVAEVDRQLADYRTVPRYPALETGGYYNRVTN